jgi:NhaP-type Na+/H+ or K+/H+ antiporter
MIIESGVIIFLGLLLLGAKLPRWATMRALGQPFYLDLGCSLLAFVMHYGTFSGVMAAAVAGLMCSGFTSAARYSAGYVLKDKYYPGKFVTVPAEQLVIPIQFRRKK